MPASRARAPKIDALREVTVRSIASDAPPAEASEPAAAPAKVQFTVYLERDLVEELRDAANVLAGYPHYLTISQIVTDGARAQLRRLKDEHNGGQAFPHTGRRDQPGRRPAR